MGGVSYLFFIRDLIERIASDWDSVQAELEDIRKLLVNRRSALFNITVDDTMWQAIQPRLDAFRLALPEAPSQRQVWSPEYVRVNEALTAPSQINYVGMGGNLYHAGYELHGSVHVITKSLSRTYLWEKIRVQGGAYGGAGTFDTHSGTFSFLSWRDPNLAGTLDNYRRASDFLRKIEMSETDLSRSVVGAIGTLDAYQLPDAKGYTSMRRHLAGITDAMRQQIREEVLATTVTDFRRFGEILSRLNDQARKVVIGSPEAVDTANSTLDDPFEVIPVI
jgi:hypothetical protein